jgi:uncharacterized OsmC-like protein
MIIMMLLIIILDIY